MQSDECINSWWVLWMLCFVAATWWIEFQDSRVYIVIIVYKQRVIDCVAFGILSQIQTQGECMGLLLLMDLEYEIMKWMTHEWLL